MTRTLCLAALALLLAAPAGSQTITGRVLPPAGGKAVAPAKIQVELAPSVEDYGQALRRLEGRPDPPLATARPRPDGSFEITAPEPGIYRVTLRAEGFLPLGYDLRPLYEEIELPPVEMEPASPVEVRALGPDGSPLAGVQVMVRAEYKPGPWQPAESFGITGADGRVALPGDGGSGEVGVFSPRLGWQYTQTRGNSATVRFTAPKLLTLEVRGARGKKTAGALVRSTSPPIPLGLTGPDGRLEVPLPHDETRLLVETADGQAALVRLGPASTGSQVAELAPPVTVSGKVLMTDRRGPVPGALVWSGETRLVRAGADGGFQVQASGAFPQAGLLAAAPGYLAQQGNVSLRSGDGGAPATATLLLSAAGFVAGRVIDPQGRPVAEAQVQLTGPGRFLGDRTRLQLRSSPDGSFRLSPLKTGETYEIQVRKEGFAPAAAFVAAAPRNAPAAPVRIVLSRGAVVFGRTVDKDGEPVAGATVELYPWVDPMRGGVLGDKPVAGTGTSGADGRFEVPNLPPGTFVLQARGDGFAPGFLNGVEVGAGTPRVDAGTVTLSPGLVVEGKVTDPRGVPVAGAQVVAFPERPGAGASFFHRPRGRPLETGADGRFRIDGLSQGSRLRVEVRAQGFGNVDLQGLELPLPEPFHIELRPLVQLAGRVAGPEGEPVAGASLALIKRRPDGASGSDIGRADDQGRFQIDVEPGRVEIEVRAGGYAPSAWRGTVPERGEIEPIEITLGRGAVLEGRVLDPAGNPVADAMVWTSPEASSATDRLLTSGRSQSDGEGRYRITELATGRHKVWVQGIHGIGTSSRFEVQPGSNRLDLTLDRKVEVSGFVRDADGAPVAGAEVTLSTKDGGRSSDRPSAADGSFRFPAVSDGPYRVTARRRGSGYARQEIEVAGQPVQGLDLRLGPAGTITGRLLGLEPADLTGVRVGAVAQYREEPATVRPDGTYQIPGLPPGEWGVFAELPSGRRADGTVRLEPGMTEAVLDLDLAGGLSLSGVVRVDGASQQARLYLRSTETDQGAGGQSRAGSDGSFRMTRLAAGAYVLQVQLDRSDGPMLHLHKTIELAAEDLVVPVEIVTGKVQGQVVSPEGAPVAEAQIGLNGNHRGWTARSFVVADAQGRFELRLPAGEYRLTASTEGRPGSSEIPFQVPAGGIASVQAPIQ